MGKNRKRAGLLICLAVVLSLTLGCGAYVNDYYPAEEGAVAHSGMEYVEISENRVVFAPEDPRAGLIFYPGGKVEFTAYAPLMAALAEEEILCVLLKMSWIWTRPRACRRNFRRWNIGIWRVTLWAAAWRQALLPGKGKPMRA